METKSDAELLDAYAETGDSVAFAELVSRYGALVYRVCFRTLSNRQDAEDASQAVFMTLLKDISRLRREGPLACWLHKVARQTALFMARTRARRKRREAAAVEIMALESQSSADGGACEVIARLLDAELMALSTIQREAVILRYLRGFSEKEASAIAGCAVTALSSRANDGIIRLRRRLTRRGLELSVPALIGVLEAEAIAEVPETLTLSLMAVRSAAPTAAAGAGSLVALMESAIKVAFMTKAKMTIVGLAVAVALGIVGGKIIIGGHDAAPVGDKPVEEKAARTAFSDGKGILQNKTKSERDTRATKYRAGSFSRNFNDPASDSFASNLQRARHEANAAEIYKMIFALMESAATKGKIERIEKLLLKPNGLADLTEAEKEELKSLLDSPELQEIFALLKEAASKSSCDFNLDYSQGVSLLLPHLNSMRGLVRLVNETALFAIGEGDTATAFELVDLGLKTSDSVNDKKLLISQLVNLACDMLMVSAIDDAIAKGTISEGQAYTLADQLASRDYAASMAAAVKEDATFVNDMIDKLATGEMSIDSIFNGDAAIDKDKIAGVLADSRLLAENKRMITEFYATMGSLLENPSDDAQARADELVDSLKSLPVDEYAVVQAVGLGSLNSILKKVTLANARRDTALTKLATAIYKSRYGKAPDSPADLKEIRDAFKR